MKICCCPVRPVLYTLAILGILRSGAQIYLTSSLVREILPVGYIIFNLFLIYAVKTKEIKILKWAQRFSLACVCLTVLPFLVFPVLSASVVASGRLGNITDLPDDILANMTTAEKRFYMGSFVGFMVELGAGFMIGVELLKYLLVTRIWKAAVVEDQFVNPDNFQAP